jgi:asparagine synthase (glutamine-hydrolysing)
LARQGIGGAQTASTERDLHRQGIAQPAYQLTLEIADKAAAAFGVEPRYPFFDRRLIEFCLALPEEQKFANGWTRLILRRAMEGILPADIQWRSTKSNLSPNFHRRFIESDHGIVERMDFTPLAPYLDVDRLRETFRHYRAECRQRDSDADGCLLFRASVLATWLSARKEGGGRSDAPANGPHAPVAA